MFYVGETIHGMHMFSFAEVDLNPDSDHMDWIAFWIDCIYTELNPDLALEKWSCVIEAYI